ncbi:MAG TPA: phosphoribosylaminoimidazolesuccinocarboxamide synthase [Thermomicrobiales bacterium]|nr:phosphoribosylaminoimidazolesuccinocarboxamide synthase [Thermomicrobiales bacterium]
MTTGSRDSLPTPDSRLPTPVLRVDLPGVPLFRRGKVRDTFDLGDRLLIVATDRISAFDVIMPSGIPGKGAILTQLSNFWFERTADLVPNHLLATDVADFPAELQQHAALLRGRSVLARKAERIDIECVVRGYLSGSAWAEYRQRGTVCGQALPPGFAESERLPEPIFTPATKADSGHDENISTGRMADLIGGDLARELERLARAIYVAAAEYAATRGIIIADTKMEFGLIDGQPVLIDELLTPDSSRFWDAAAYEPGRPQDSLDKQPLRDWLVASGWNKEPPAPSLPQEVVARIAGKYASVYERLTGARV